VAQAAEGRTDEAIAVLGRALTAGAERAETEYNLGLLLAAKGRTAESETHFGRALTGRPSFPAAWYQLGGIRAAQARTDEAIACWRRALEIDPTHTASYVAICKALIDRFYRAGTFTLLRLSDISATQPD